MSNDCYLVLIYNDRRSYFRSWFWKEISRFILGRVNAKQIVKLYYISSNLCHSREIDIKISHPNGKFIFIQKMNVAIRSK